MRQPTPKAQIFSVARVRAGLCHGARSDAIHPLSDFFTFSHTGSFSAHCAFQ